mmetsp:Transcript_27427/g.31705  ORF Transcript_27427/g.31705 Transcript_27427/m.31705 type:complete len:138 (+) Transcript_27427:237-650(+)
MSRQPPVRGKIQTEKERLGKVTGDGVFSRISPTSKTGPTNDHNHDSSTMVGELNWLGNVRNKISAFLIETEFWPHPALLFSRNSWAPAGSVLRKLPGISVTCDYQMPAVRACSMWKDRAFPSFRMYSVASTWYEDMN